MFADALLASVAATERSDNPAPQESSLTALTCNEIKCLFNTFITARHETCDSDCAGQPGDAATNAALDTSHYQRRQAIPA